MDTLDFLTPLSSSIDPKSPPAERSNSYSHFQIRAAQPGELTSLAEILADSFHSQQGILSWAYPLLRLGIYEDLRNRFRSTLPHHICLVAVRTANTAKEGCQITSDVAGTVEMALRSIEPFTKTRSRYLYLSNLAVYSTYRRRGVAKQLLLNCERVALEWGFQDLSLHVLENNYQARQLYFKLGYRLHKVDSGWNAWLLGRPRQLFLHKHLSSASTP